MYYPYFIAYMASGFIISIVVFLWALNKGQFNDQKRARFLPLENDIRTGPVKKSRFARIEAIVLFSLVCVTLLCSAAVIMFALLKLIK